MPGAQARPEGLTPVTRDPYCQKYDVTLLAIQGSVRNSPSLIHIRKNAGSVDCGGNVSVWGEVVVGLVILVGLTGIVVPILPGVILIFGAIAVWAFLTGGAVAWTVFAIATVLLTVSGVVKYTWPGRKLKEAGVPNRTLLLGGIAGIVGFFLIPVVGLFVGFVVGVYLSELQRLPEQRQAWESSKQAIKGVGLSMLVELLGALLAGGVWLVGAIAA